MTNLLSSLNTKTVAPTLTGILASKSDELNPRDDDTKLGLAPTVATEVLALIDDGLLEATDLEHSAGGRTVELTGGLLRLATVSGGASLYVSKEDGHLVEVTSTEQGVWWKVLRNLLLDALETEAKNRANDTDSLENVLTARLEGLLPATETTTTEEN